MKRLFRVLLLFLILSFIIKIPGASAEKALSEKRINEIEEIVTRSMKEWKVPGVAMAVIKDGRIIYTKGFGYRDAKNKLPVTTETVFPIGSCSKAFTSFIAGLLVDEGILDWDKPVISYLPDFRLYDPSATRLMTVRDMLCHRTGLPTGAGELMNFVEEFSRKDIYERMRYLKPDRSFRESFEYCNMPFMTTGYLEERLCGKSWEELVRERIFKPLEMSNSSFSPDEIKKNPNYSLPYVVNNEEITEVEFASIEALGPAGSINSNVQDMAKWLILHMKNGKIGDKQLISDTSLNETHSAQVVAPHYIPMRDKLPELEDVSYCMGWGVNNYRGHRMIWHGGTIRGFRASVGFLPREGIGIVFLSNGESEMRTFIPWVIYDRLLGLEPIDWNSRFKVIMSEHYKALKNKELSNKKKINKNAGKSKPSHIMSDFCGRFVNPVYGRIDIKVKNGSLKGTYYGYRFVLKHCYYDIFRANQEEPFKVQNPLGGELIQFHTDGYGNIYSLSFCSFPETERMVFKKH
ncbi:MAG: serine hydrolase [Candidatus Eremiobacteraeota bacterium]|nr:serine hydrolase [Candidatus Eremiobacteraeota bacterium]